MTQNNQLRDHLTNGNSITPIEALQEFGCFRLAARISDLKSQGMDIHTEMVYKDKKKYARYFLKKD